MRTALLVALILALAAAAAWALAAPKLAAAPYKVEVRDVAGVTAFTVVPEVVAAASGHYVMPEVVVRANAMPEVVAHAPVEARVAGVPANGIESVN
jgi:hypothetical protein